MKLFLTLLTLFLLSCTPVTPEPPIENKIPRSLISYPGLSLVPNNNIDSYCETEHAFATKLLSLPSPSKHIQIIQHNDALVLWKNLFLHINSVTEDYFDDHIRITSATFFPHSSIYIDSPSQLMIGYQYIIDWAVFNIPGYILLEDESQHQLTEAQILKNTTQLQSLSHTINKIAVHGKIANHIIPCSSAIQAIKERYPNALFVDTRFTNEQLALTTIIPIDILPNQCKVVSINLESGTLEEGDPYYCGPVD